MTKRAYQITFKAELSEDDLRAMNKCFYDTMNEGMGIYDLWDLKMEEVKPSTPEPGKYQPSLEELLKIPMDHIQKVKDCFEACTSKADVQKVIDIVPAMFGELEVSFDDEYGGFTVTNTYYDTDDYQIEKFWFDYPEDWDYEEEEE